MIPIQNKLTDEITNRLTMAIAIMGSHMECRHSQDGVESMDIWGAQQLVEDAKSLFEEIHFPGNRRLNELLNTEPPWDEDGD